VSIGTIVLLGGGAVLIAASVTDNQKLSLHQQQLTKTPSERLPEAAADITQLHQTSSVLFPAGWIVLGVGAATTITGGFLFLLPNTPASPSSRVPHKEPSTSVFYKTQSTSRCTNHFF